MSLIQIKPNVGFKQGEVEVPTSKSLTNRALIIQNLCKDTFVINNLSKSDDSQNLNDLLNSNKTELNVGPAGTNFRFLLALLSSKEGIYQLTGNNRIKERPIQELVDALNSIGAQIEYSDKPGYAPLKIIGRDLIGGDVEIDAEVSSQFISALALIAPLCKKRISITLKGKVVSKPYIKMTLELMHYFGIQYSYQENCISIEPQGYTARDYTVEADWSSAAFWFGIISNYPGSELLIRDLSSNSLQGDKKCIEYFGRLGVSTKETTNGITLKGSNTVPNELAFDLSGEPDLFPVLAFTCAGKGVKAVFTGLHNLHLKESDRIEAVKTELTKLGLQCSFSYDNFLFEISGKIVKKELEMDSYGDHRMVMAAASLMPSVNSIKIHDNEVVSKSYPGFWHQLEASGVANFY